jgi:hypothetical protein
VSRSRTWYRSFMYLEPGRLARLSDWARCLGNCSSVNRRPSAHHGHWGNRASVRRADYPPFWIVCCRNTDKLTIMPPRPSQCEKSKVLHRTAANRLTLRCLTTTTVVAVRAHVGYRPKLVSPSFGESSMLMLLYLSLALGQPTTEK